jgi:magnesium transporter
LLISPPGTPISELMRTDVVSVRPDMSSDDVAGALVKYDLLAVPVAEEDGRLVGIVTIDHLIDLLLEKYGPRKLGGGMDLLHRKAIREGAGAR